MINTRTVFITHRRTSYIESRPLDSTHLLRRIIDKCVSSSSQAAFQAVYSSFLRFLIAQGSPSLELVFFSLTKQHSCVL